MTLKKQFIQVLPLAVIMGGLLTYNFINAQWVGPAGNPTTNNIAAPINVSAVTQTKTGDLVVDSLAAVTDIRSDYYCDALGLNCVNQPDLNTFAAYSTTRLNRQSGIRDGQKVSVSCVEEGDGTGNATDFEIMTGGGCRVIGTYNELVTDEGDVFSYPLPGLPGPMTWNCENKNLASSTIEATAVCLKIHTAVASLPPPA